MDQNGESVHGGPGSGRDWGLPESKISVVGGGRRGCGEHACDHWVTEELVKGAAVGGGA